jgi:hypothetical protein
LQLREEPVERRQIFTVRGKRTGRRWRPTRHVALASIDAPTDVNGVTRDRFQE